MALTDCLWYPAKKLARPYPAMRSSATASIT